MNKEKILEYTGIFLLIVGFILIGTVVIQIFRDLVGAQVSTGTQVIAGLGAFFIGGGSFAGGLALVGAFSEK